MVLCLVFGNGQRGSSTRLKQGGARSATAAPPTEALRSWSRRSPVRRERTRGVPDGGQSYAPCGLRCAPAHSSECKRGRGGGGGVRQVSAREALRCHTHTETTTQGRHVGGWRAECGGRLPAALALTVEPSAVPLHERFAGRDVGRDDVVLAARPGKPILDELAALLLQLHLHVDEPSIRHHGGQVVGCRRARDSTC